MIFLFFFGEYFGFFFTENSDEWVSCCLLFGIVSVIDRGINSVVVNIIIVVETETEYDEINIEAINRIFLLLRRNKIFILPEYKKDQTGESEIYTIYRI